MVRCRFHTKSMIIPFAIHGNLQGYSANTRNRAVSAHTTALHGVDSLC
nr:MAG TPA: hypothetical protein [Caudoviricetes sp.]